MSVYFRYVHTEKGKMSPKYRHEPEARGTQAKNYPSRYVQHCERPTKRVYKTD